MKKIAVLIFMCLCTHSYSQYDFKKLKKVSIEDLKSRTLIVPFGNLNSDLIKNYEEVFEKYWKISKFKIVHPNQMDEYKNDINYYYFDFYNVTERSNYGVYHFHYFRLNYLKEFGSIKKVTHLAEFDLFLKNGTYMNLTPGLMKLYIIMIQNYLTDRKEYRVNKKINKEEISKLKYNTLYIPDYVLFKVLFPSGYKPVDEKDMLKTYNGKYKIVSSEEFDRVILEANSTTFILVCIVSEYTDIVIFNAQSGKIALQFRDILNKSLVPNDFSRINKHIR
jgi:hypothetical protein